ncbi:xanthine/CO dehydrogenase XdhC/CoxF family maturation factor [Chitinophaga dinghuensis]|uniref:Xanthine/CO dehydrogenase XdhC/CoxF family maturation factor n=1 Tax=Chitinophaga dinghuensis TaxID=1539050 RepID=A0A327WAX2_9BACT|nr:XdhC/CoxI family protein [Chitinophaga dinghuensis]RAJ87897.1 xanthine/CO dehydrogenase XdhC/CoxF family maturation factor [Chitinophaga dinghuensis]
MIKELEDIVKAYDIAQQQGLRTALATVVHVDGSAYRQPGARMLVTENGTLTGAISGGCLEGDALRKAQLVMMQQQPMLVVYDTTDEDDAQLGVGLGCNGIIYILLEPITAEDSNNPLQLIRQLISTRQESILITLFNKEQRKDIQPGTRMLCRQHKNVGTIPGDMLQQAILQDVQEAYHQRASIIKSYVSPDYQLTALLSYITPATQLIIVGAGNDAQPLARIAQVMGWHVHLLDGRPNYATATRFPDTTIHIAKAENALEHLVPDAYSAAILMTHNYNYDLKILQQLVHFPLPYIGVLGPAKKLQRMLEESDSITAIQRERIYGPAGLDIAAATPEEIALSIASEIKRVTAGPATSGQSLRDKKGAIHNRRAQIITTQHL